MRRLVLTAAMVLLVPLAGRATEFSSRGHRGVASDNLGQALRTTTSYHRTQNGNGNAFQVHIAPVAFFSFDSDLNNVVNTPVWGADAGFVYWIGQQLGLGLSGQYFSANGSGKVDHIDTEADFTYYNIFVNVYSRIFGTDSVKLYGVAGIGYSNAHIWGEGDRGLMHVEFDQVDEGPGYHAGLGISGPWIFGEVRYSESSFGSETNDDGETEITVLNGIQGLIGVRTP